MVERANKIREMPSSCPPHGSIEKAYRVSSPEEQDSIPAGLFRNAATISSPVMPHITTVSQKTPVIDIKPWEALESVSVEPAVIPAVPIPASFVNNPLAIP